MKLIPNGRIWIDTEQGAFLGYGRMELLEKVQQTGSLRKAALEMKMSYQQAWKLIQQMNLHAETPILILQKGGSGGGSAILTETGQKVMNEFKEFNLRFQEFLLDYSQRLNP